MKNRPLTGFTVCWVAGSAAAYATSGTSLLLAWAGWILLLSALAIWGKMSWKYIAVLGLAFILAGVYWEWTERHNVSVLPESIVSESIAGKEGISVHTMGTIISTVERDGDRVDFTIRMDKVASEEEAWTKVQGEKIIVQVKLAAESEIAVAAQWHRGDKVELNGTLEQPSAARNFGGFDYQAYLLAKEIHWILKVKGAQQVDAAQPTSWSLTTLLRWNDGVRTALSEEMDRLYEKRNAGYMKGLVIGIQQDLDPETFRQFSQLGLTHILVISGMHVAVFVAVLLFILMRFLRLTKETAQTLVLLLVPVYVLLSGAGPSVIRAGIMIMIALLAARAGVLKDGLNILSASALLMLVWNPYFLLSVSFQLSFLVTLGLMTYVPLANALLTGLPRWLGGAIAVTLIAQWVSFPLTIYYFNQFSLLSIAANFLLVPLITVVVLPLGVATLLLGRLWGGAANVLAVVAEWINNLTFNVVEWMNGWSVGVTIWRSPSLYWIGAYYLLLYGLLYAGKKLLENRFTHLQLYMEDETRPLAGLHPHLLSDRGRVRLPNFDTSFPYPNLLSLFWSPWSVSLLTLCFALLIYRGYQPENHSGSGTISYFDVGQGDSILITTPGGSNILVDGGGTVSFGEKEKWRIRRSPFEVGAKVLLPLLKKRGIHRLDAIILTHGDQDHAGGLQAVLEGIPVSALLFNGTIAEGEPYIKLMRTALDRNVQLYGIHQGMKVSPDKNTELSFLWPGLEEGGRPDVLPILEEQNHNSVVFRLSMDGSQFLFTGDMDKEAEEMIIERESNHSASAQQRVDIFKAAHHGSKTSNSDAWLKYWNPSAVVISAGVNNLYGHPSGEVLDRLAANKIPILRTDQQGEIQMEIHKGSIRVRHKLN
ncbi:ComEC/Rec2 family competence protein [Paenibacillus wynnii]|uniref:Metallo-beta-lactamase domain-containing protein n=1 Tax=Paenibacillus wynnii TaxID=268407 RepID=A0A098M859_9BACL|nr:ComEC/Rec2 family competence protein [Paenibacillus wynnii]KGE18223.1 hypothetical protein PWYN_27220 [Paenibacillus wynnii]